MEIRELRAFVAVVEEGGLSAAARRLGMSQSSLSQTMQSLEKQAGAALLIRDHAGARPTQLGTTLLAEARILLDHHDRIVASMAGPADATQRPLRIGVPLELPAGLLPAALAEVNAAYPELDVEVRHARSSDQLAALKAGELDVALVRDRPVDPRVDSVLAVEESMGVILTTARADALCESSGVRLHRLAGLSWIEFARRDAPAWHDQVSATLRAHGVVGVTTADDDRAVPPEVKLAAVSAGHSFALAAYGWARPLPDGLTWHPLVGDPIVRRTWAAWAAESRRRELGRLIVALDLTGR